MNGVNFTPREAQQIERMLDLRSLHHGPACAPIGEWLVKQAKRTWPRFAGLRGISKTNVRRRWNLIAYHHPAQLCWEWFLSVELFPTDGQWWRLFGGYNNQHYFGVRYLFRFSFFRQPQYAWMLSDAAKNRLRAIAETKAGAS